MAFENSKTLNKQEIAEIYEEHSPGVYRYAYRLLGDEEIAEDCVSETFSRFLHTLGHEKRPIVNTKAYLYRMAHNWVIDHYRKKPLQPIALDDDLPIGAHESPTSKIVQNALKEHVRAALLRLPPEQQLVIQLRFLEDWSHDEVAAALGKTSEATRALQYRAMEALRRALVKKELLNEDFE